MHARKAKNKDVSPKFMIPLTGFSKRSQDTGLGLGSQHNEISKTVQL